MSKSASWPPLPTRIDPHVRDQLDAQARDLLDTVLQDYHKFHRLNDHDGRWKSVRKQGTFCVYSDRSRGASSDRGLLSSGLAPGNVEDLVAGLFTDTTESFRIGLALTESTWHDAAVLDVFESNPSSNAVVFSGIKYIANEGQAFMISNRDVVCYDALGWVRDDHGTFFAYSITFSVDLPEYPPYLSQGLERVQFSRASLFWEVKNGWVGSFGKLDINCGGTMLLPLVDYLASTRVNMYFSALACSRAKLYAQLLDTSCDVAVPDMKTCGLCIRKPRLLTKLRPCAACHRVVCKSCRHHRHIFELPSGSKKPSKHIFCVQCIHRVESASQTMMIDLFRDWSSRSSRTSSSPSTQYPCDRSNFSSSETYAWDDNQDERSMASSLSMSYAVDRQDIRVSSASTSSAMRKDSPSSLLAEHWDELKSGLQGWNAKEVGEMAKKIGKEEHLEDDLGNNQRISASDLD